MLWICNKRQKWPHCVLTRYLITRVSVNTRSRELFARIIRANNSRQCETALTHIHVFVSRNVTWRHVVLQWTRLIVRSRWAKQWKLSTQTCPCMSKVAHGRVLVSQNGAESYRGQSSWSVVLSGWCLYFMVVMHTYLLRHMAGENRGQCLDKCTGVCI